MLAIKGSTEGSQPTVAPVADVASGDVPRLGELLVESQLVSSSRLDEALLQQAASGKRLGELLVELGAIDDFDLARVLASRLDLPVADLRKDTPEDDAIALVPESLARAHVAIPVRRTEIGLQMAMADPAGRRGGADVGGCGRRGVIRMVAPPSDIRRAIDKSYRALAGVGRHVDAFLAAEAITARTVEESDAGGDAPVVQVVNLIVTQGVRDRASDIHIEPQDDARPRPVPDRRRACTTCWRFPRTWAPSVVSRIKVLAGMDIVERRKPQDGQIAIEVDGRPLDIRVVHDRDDLGREERDAAARQEPVALPAGRPRDARRDPRRVLSTDPRAVRDGRSAPARREAARPRRCTRRSPRSTTASATS